MKYVYSVMMFLVPLLFALGLIRINTGHNPTEFIPQWEDLMYALSAAPADAFGSVQEAVTTFNQYSLVAQQAWANVPAVKDLASFFAAIGPFFSAVGRFFEMIGQGIHVAGTAIAVPFTFIGYIVGLLLG